MDQILNSLNLDTNFQKFKYAELKPYLMNDKKVSSGKLNLIIEKHYENTKSPKSKKIFEDFDRFEPHFWLVSQ